MTNTTYNGWTNYATWRITLEFFDGYNPFEQEKNAFDLMESLCSYVKECLEMNCENDTTLSYALSFIEDVNWYEVAEHLIKEEVQNEN